MTFAYFCQQVWPNLAADVIWVPVVWIWHHIRLSRLLEQQREHIVREIREHMEGN